MKMDKNDYCAVYRTGGTDNFVWKNTVCESRIKAAKTAEELRRMGYKTYVYKWSDLLTVGHPNSYEY
jgi:hypothetical protein